MKGKETLLFVVVAAALIGAFYLIIYRPSAGEIETLRSGVQRYQGLDVREKAIEELHTRKLSEIAVLTSEVENLEERLLLGTEEDSFLKELREYVRISGVYDESLTRQETPVIKGNQSFLSMNVRLKGLFQNIYTFLRFVEDMDKNVWFDNVKLRRIQGKEGIVALDMNLRVPMMVEEE
jgi:Tfp pilus assembly protein PilO